MDYPKMSWKQPKTMADIKSILDSVQNLDLMKMDKDVFLTLLNGFRVIVDVYENQLPEMNNEDNQHTILIWMRLYLSIQALVKYSEARSELFSSTIPTAITYHIGCLLNVTNVGSKFYTEYMKMLVKLMSRTDSGKLKKLQTCAKGLIDRFWEVINKVGNFDNQVMVLKIIYLILRNFDANSAFSEVSRISNINASIMEKLLALLKVSSQDILYQKLSREILHQYNMLQGSCASVHSFFCKSITISDQLSFSKTKHCDHFCIDINTDPHTLTFRGLFTPKSGSYDENVEVSLDIKKLSCIKNKLKIEYKSLAFISSTAAKELMELKAMSEAYAILSSSEMNRFMKTFKVKENVPQQGASLKKDKENSSSNSDCDDTSPSNNQCDNGSFKKPSLELYESAVRIPKLKPLGPQETSFYDENHKIDSIQQNPVSIYSNINETSLQTTTEKKRFFKNPRQPTKMEIPWKTKPTRKSYSTSNRKKQIQKVQPVQPNTCAVRGSGKESNSNIENSTPNTAGCVVNPYYDGPSTSRAAVQLQNQFIEKKMDEMNENNQLKKTSECHAAVSSFAKPIEKVLSATSPELLGNRQDVKATESESTAIRSTNIESLQQNANSIEVNDVSKKRTCTFLKRKIEGAVSDSDFKTSSDEDDYPKRKRLVKRRRINSKKIKL